VVEDEGEFGDGSGVELPRDTCARNPVSLRQQLAKRLQSTEEKGAMDEGLVTTERHSHRDGTGRYDVQRIYVERCCEIPRCCG
jgi:hypothetical protein